MNAILQLLSKHRQSIMGFAILWVMLRHLPISVGFFPIDFLKIIGYGGVDVFLFLSGFGLYFAMSKINFSLKEYYKNRFIRIIPEFWFVLCIVFLVKMNFNVKSFLLMIGEASTLGYWVGLHMDLWYISCIILFYAIYPIYFSLFKKNGYMISILFILGGGLLILIYALVCTFLFDKRNIGGLIILTYARIPIFFIGAVFGHWAKDGCNIALTKKIKLFGILIAFLSICTLGCFIKNFPEETLWIYSLYFVPFIFIVPVLCLILAKIFEKLSFADRLFTHIGLISLELYMCHVYLYKSISFFSEKIGGFLGWILIILLSFVSAYSLFFINKYFFKKKLKNIKDKGIVKF